MGSDLGALPVVYDVAGPDVALRRAVEDLQVGRWLAMRDLLAVTGCDWALRTARSQVLAAAAVRSQAVRAWQREEPGSTDALVMAARVEVERALLAHRRRLPQHQDQVSTARRACHRAAQVVPLDPVPWVCLLALAATDELQRQPEHRQPSGEPMLPPGPWSLLNEVQLRDFGNREAAHRALRFWLARRQGSLADAFDFVRWVLSWAPAGSPLLLLPLYGHAEQFRRLRDSNRLDPLIRRQWAHDHIAADTERALAGWFDQPAAAARAPLDLNVLAHALWAGDRLEDAARVFAAIGPYATRTPWSQTASTADQAEREFCYARSQCLHAVS